MKKWYQLFLIVVVAFVTLAVNYQLIRASYTLELFGTTKYNAFQIGMSVVRAKSLFSAYGELVSSTEMKGEYGNITMLTFQHGDLEESLTLHFVDGKLSSFQYINWEAEKGG